MAAATTMVLFLLHAISAAFCSDGHLMHLVRLLVFFVLYYNFWFYASHIEGHANSLADALSCNNLHLFFSQVSPKPLLPAVVPQSLLAIISDNIAWTSTAWTRLFTTILLQV